MESHNLNLIYDIGMHRGEDTEFYLKKGFHVVSIEANKQLCTGCELKFSNQIKEGKLTIVNQAISNANGLIDFYVNEKLSVWGTADIDWVKRNEKRGAKSHSIKVPSTTLSNIISDYGCPYYMKIDIEGYDHLCLEHLLDCVERPAYISVESSATSMRDTMYQLELLNKLGYKKYKIIPQMEIDRQSCPKPALEGLYIEHQFESGSSGLFGRELEGEWLNYSEVRSEYRRIHFEMRMIGLNNGIFSGIRSTRAQSLFQKIFPRGKDWFDTHAML